MLQRWWVLWEAGLAEFQASVRVSGFPGHTTQPILASAEKQGKDLGGLGTPWQPPVLAGANSFAT